MSSPGTLAQQARNDAALTAGIHVASRGGNGFPPASAPSPLSPAQGILPPQSRQSGVERGSTPRKEPGRRFGGGTVAPAGGGRRGCHGASGHGRAGVPSLATGATGATKSAAPDTPAPVPQPGPRGVPLGSRRGGPRGGHRRRGGRRGSPLVVELREVGGEGRILGRPAVEDASTRPCEERRPSTWERRGFPLPAGGLGDARPRPRTCEVSPTVGHRAGAEPQGTGEARRSGAGSRGSATFRPLRVLRRLPRFRAYPAG